VEEHKYFQRIAIIKNIVFPGIVFNRFALPVCTLWQIPENWNGSHQDNSQNGEKNSLMKLI